MKEISFEDFEKVEIRVGVITSVEDFPEAKKPAYIITCDFGPDIGVKKTSARITEVYTKEELEGRQVVGVVNFPIKQIGPVRSEFLLTGFYNRDGHVVLAVPDREVPLGSKLV
ncbi:MAG: tRNA-binding protein [bacterium]